MATLRFQITNHAADRYIERVSPGVTRDEARRTMMRLARSARVEAPPGLPRWDRDRTDLWLRVGEEVWLACRRAKGRTMRYDVTTVYAGGVAER